MPNKLFITNNMITASLNNLPEMNTVILDTFFPKRKNNESPYLAKLDLENTIKNMPAIRKNGKSILRAGGAIGATLIEPQEISFHDYISDADENRLRALGSGAIQSYLDGQVASARESVRYSAEALAAQGLVNGKIDYMIQTETGYVRYEVDFAAERAKYVMSKNWNSAKLSEISLDAVKISSAIRKNGGRGQIVFGCGSEVFATLADLVSSSKGKNMGSYIKGTEIFINGFKFVLVSDVYYDRDASGKEIVKDILGEKDIVASAVETNLFTYSSIDDKKASFKAMPLFIKNVDGEDGEGQKIKYKSKPFPLPNLRASYKATVLS